MRHRRRRRKRRGHRALRRWAAKVTRSPKTGVLGLLATVLLVAVRLGDLLHQLGLL